MGKGTRLAVAPAPGLRAHLPRVPEQYVLPAPRLKDPAQQLIERVRRWDAMLGDDEVAAAINQSYTLRQGFQSLRVTGLDTRMVEAILTLDAEQRERCIEAFAPESIARTWMQAAVFRVAQTEAIARARQEAVAARIDRLVRLDAFLLDPARRNDQRPMDSIIVRIGDKERSVLDLMRAMGPNSEMSLGGRDPVSRFARAYRDGWLIQLFTASTTRKRTHYYGGWPNRNWVDDSFKDIRDDLARLIIV